MKRTMLFIFLVFCLTGCTRENAKICSDIEPLITADHSDIQYDPKSGLPQLNHTSSPEAANTLNAATLCTKEWGWKLAKSQGPNEQVADAVVQACHAEIDAVIKLPHIVFDLGDGGIAGEAKHSEEVINDFKKRALLRVIQGRAGHCRYKS